MPPMNPVRLTRATIHITDLRLQTIIGINDWERTQRQDVVINATMDFDPSAVVATGELNDTLDYRTIKRRIVELVEHSDYGLLEQLTHAVVQMIMSEKRIISTTVRVDKPTALRLARSVSVEMSAERER